MRNLYLIVAIAGLLTFGAVSCTQPASEDSERAASLTPVPPPTSPTPVQSSVPPLPTEAPMTPEAQPQAPAEPAPSQQVNLVPNGSFEGKDGTGRPNGWGVSPASILVPAERQAKHGEQYIAMTSLEDREGSLFCDLQIPEDAAGKTFTVDAWGKSSVDNGMKLVLVCKENGAEKEVAKRFWSKVDDEWTQISFTAQLPESAEPGSAKLRVILLPNEEARFALDDVRVFVN